MKPKRRQVKITVSIAGAWGSYAPGQVVEMDDKEAQAWVKRGHAVMVPSEIPPKGRKKK